MYGILAVNVGELSSAEPRSIDRKFPTKLSLEVSMKLSLEISRKLPWKLHPNSDTLETSCRENEYLPNLFKKYKTILPMTSFLESF